MIGHFEAILTYLGISLSYKIKHKTFLNLTIFIHTIPKPTMTSHRKAHLAKNSRPDIVFAVHQLVRISPDHCKYHGMTMIYLGM